MSISNLPNRTCDMYIAKGAMPGMADEYLAFRLRVIASVIYTLTSVAISRD